MAKTSICKRNHKLILFDIDCTLVNTGGAGSRALNLIFEDLFSIKDAFRTVRMAGKTDPAIIREGLEFHGICSVDGIFEKCKEKYLLRLRHEMRTSKNRRVMPGIKTILEALSGDSSVVLGLLTGNMEEGAKIKLGEMGLYNYFRLGAYGSDDDDRNKLLAFAMDRYQRLAGDEIKPEQVAVIGDTPRDIECSKPFGATAVAVATGPYSKDELAAHDPDHLFKDLSDTEAFLRLI